MDNTVGSNASSGPAPVIPPSSTNMVTPPQIGDSGAISGLSGNMTPSQPAAPAEEPQPHESVARHIMEALSGSTGKPMDWARGILSGGLAAAANVGKVPEGGGFLTGASRGAAGFQELQRQKVLDQQKQQQITFEQQEKQKADQRADQELQIHSDDAKAQRALWTAQTAASIQNQQQIAARFGDLQKEDQLKVKELTDKIQESENNQLAILSANGVDISKLEHITNSSQLTSSHAKQLGAGDIFPVQNGEAHAAGEDKAGAYLVPGNVWEKPISEPVTIITGYEIGKDGKITTKTKTATEGTEIGTLLAIAKGAQTDLANKQKQIMDRASLQQKNAETQKTIADTELARSQIAQGSQKDALGGTFTPPAGGIKEANKIKDSFKKDADNLAKTEGTFNQFQDILRDINTGKGMTGAQSVVALFNAIGISAEPLAGKGFRINHNIVEEHQEARGLGESLYQKLLSLKKGDVITPQQVKDYAEIALRSRHDAYVNKINEARGQGINPDFLLPRGNGQRVDANTAQILYDTAAGNTPQEKAENAKKAAAATGWKF